METLLISIIPALAVIIGILVTRYSASPFRAITIFTGILLAAPACIVGNILIMATASSGMLSAKAAWYIQVFAIPPVTLLLGMLFIWILCLISGGSGQDEALPPVVDKLVLFAASTASAILICSILALPAMTSALHPASPKAAPATVPAMRTMDIASKTSMNVPVQEVFKVREKK